MIKSVLSQNITPECTLQCKNLGNYKKIPQKFTQKIIQKCTLQCKNLCKLHQNVHYSVKIWVITQKIPQKFTQKIIQKCTLQC